MAKSKETIPDNDEKAKDSTDEMSPETTTTEESKDVDVFKPVSVQADTRGITTQTDAMYVLGKGCLVRTIILTATSTSVTTTFIPNTKLVPNPDALNPSRVSVVGA